jgi:hypothetical protein
MFWKGPVVLAGHQLSWQPPGWPSALAEIPGSADHRDQRVARHLLDEQLRARCTALIANVARPIGHVAGAWSALAADNHPSDAAQVELHRLKQR